MRVKSTASGSGITGSCLGKTTDEDMAAALLCKDIRIAGRANGSDDLTIQRITSS